VYFSCVTSWISYQLCLEANIVGDHIRLTFEKRSFEKLIDAHSSLPTAHRITSCQLGEQLTYDDFHVLIHPLVMSKQNGQQKLW